MLRINNLCFFLLGGSILTFVFQAIASLTGAGKEMDFVWKKLSLADTLGAEQLSWIDNIEILNFNNFAGYILNMPMYAFLFCLTILFFIVGSIFKRH